MSERLYYHDSYRTLFDAQVVEYVRNNDSLAVVLDGSYFYPTSGGQPCDKGTLNGVQVVDVSIRAKDGAVLHLLADEIWDDRVQGKIDWLCRFDHMQQHTGQHILSAIFLKVARAETIGFHLGRELSTIDLNSKSLSAPQIEKVEELANQVIFSNRQVRSAILTPEQIAKLPLRKAPQVNGPVRIVEIERLEITTCGGTHVSHTGEIGIIKITRLENRPRGLRVEFRCGRRALVDYRFKNNMITKIANNLTTGLGEVDQAVNRLRQEVKSLRGQLRQADAHLLEFEARTLLHSAEEHNKLRVVSAVFTGRERRDINWIAKTLTGQPGVVALLGLAGEKSHILFARSPDVNRDMRTALKTALRVLGSTAGGGRAELAQGGGPAADEKRVEQAIDRAKRLLLAQRS